MAGIGFVLRKLSRQGSLIGIAQAYIHAALAATGPWLFTVCTLGGMMILGREFMSRTELYEFRLLIIYNFAFSLVMSGPIFMVATRYLADAIHNKNVEGAPSLLLGALLLLYGIQLPIVCLFYLGYAELSLPLALSTIINFMLITSIWLIMVFLTALKNYTTITINFLLGLAISLLAAVFLASNYGSVGMMNGFSLGLAFISASLIAHIFSEYPYDVYQPFAFLPYFKKYWEIALGGLVYNMAVWVDKWIMWFSAEAERTPSKLLLYSNYDAAMFLAYLTIVPSMAFFVFSIETNFFEHYLKFYRDIQQQATFSRIKANHRALIMSVINNSRNALILQGSISMAIILLSPRIFEAFTINYLQIGIFRFGVLGALFHVMMMFLVILLSYFDNRKASLWIQCYFLISNALLTWFFMNKGFAYYGYGYFLASISTFLIAAIVVARYINKLPYHTFITNNTSV